MTPNAHRAPRFWVLVALVCSGWVVFLVQVLRVDPEVFAANAGEMTTVLLALFAIGMAVAFYMRAERVAQEHYGRTYAFTERVGATISRLEVGLSAQLAELVDAQKRDQAAVVAQPDRVLTLSPDPLGSASKIADERDRLVTDFARDINRQFEDVDQFVAHLGALEAEYRQQMDNVDPISPEQLLSEVSAGHKTLPEPLVSWVREVVVPKLGGITEVSTQTPATLESRFAQAASEFDQDAVQLARDHAIVDHSNHLTGWGLVVLRRLDGDGQGY